MKESIGYTVTLNIAIVFITIVIAFLVAALIYFKSNKISNVIVNSIEKYEGYNNLSREDILVQMNSMGYSRVNIKCGTINCDNDEEAVLVSSTASDGYCVFYCEELKDGDKYYYYKVKSLLSFNLPIINELVKYPIVTSTERMYNF